MLGEDLGATFDVPLESAFFDQAPGTDSLDFLEYRPRAGEESKVRMSLGTPFEIFPHDAAKLVRRGGLQAKGCAQHDVIVAVQYAVIVSKLEIIDIDGTAFAR